jgi:hypothetical protein
MCPADCLGNWLVASYLGVDAIIVLHVPLAIRVPGHLR